MAGYVVAVGIAAGEPAAVGHNGGVVFGCLSVVSTDTVLVGMLFD